MKTITKDKKQFSFDPAVVPAETAESGETVCFQTQDCYAEQIDYDKKDFALLDMKRNNPITGPLFVNGAEPGDILKIDILDITPEDHGTMCVRLGSGVYDVQGCHCRRFPINDNKVLFDNNVEIPLKPMIGVIGTCLEKACDTQAPGEHGGNLDIKDLGIGNSIYLPVSVPGALLSIGDCHAVQGDGETAICAVEISASVIVRVSVIKGNSGIPTPFIETERTIITTNADESLDAASIEAARKMHKYLIRTTDYTDAQAAMMLSLVGNLRISQVVNPKKGCIMEFPKCYL